MRCTGIGIHVREGNLLVSTEIAAEFLDASCVRLFTAGSNRIFKLIPGDVGRPITDIASELAYPELAADARELLRTLVVREQAVVSRDGRWFQVHIMPYRSLENMFEGVAITFADILKSVFRQLQETGSEAELFFMNNFMTLERFKDGKLTGRTFVRRQPRFPNHHRARVCPRGIQRGSRRKWRDSTGRE